MRFDLVDLRLFLAIIEAGSITHGATSANLSLAAASERLRDMEVTAGVKLLERGRRGTVPTEAGEALAHHARLILRQVSDMQIELGERAKSVRARVRLLVNTAAMTEFLPWRLGAWLASHPRVDIELRERQSSDIVKSVRAGLADLGIISDAVEAEGLLLQPFARDRLVLIAPHDHPLAAEKQISFHAILDERFVGLAQGALQEHINGHAARAGRRLTFRAKVRTFDGICAMVSQGAGIGVVPIQAAARCQRELPIVCIPLHEPWANRRLSLCFRRYEELQALARDLLQHLGERREDIEAQDEVSPKFAGPSIID